MIAALFAAALIGCPAPRVIDGDTIACGRAVIRLSGIDAPEMPGHCRAGRACVPGDPIEARDSLMVGLALGRVSYQPIGRDRYGRIIAVVRAGENNLSCWQIIREAAVYVRRWDAQQRIGLECGR